MSLTPQEILDKNFLIKKMHFGVSSFIVAAIILYMACNYIQDQTFTYSGFMRIRTDTWKIPASADADLTDGGLQQQRNPYS